MNLVFVGKSGSGKSHLASKLCELFGYTLAVSTTTREKRVGEIDGVDYNFTSIAEFEKMIEKGELIEYTNYNGNMYGLTREEMRGNRKIFILDPNGFDAVADNKNILSFYIDADIETRCNRMAIRGDTNESIIQRVSYDDIAFGGVWANTDFSIGNDGDDLTAIMQILEDVGSVV